MTDFNFLADDGLVDALIVEIAGLLRRLIEDGEEGSIDLLGLPLSPSCLAALERRLGQGEIEVQLDAAGRSKIRETGFPGVWWTTHADEAGRVIAHADRGGIRARHRSGAARRCDARPSTPAQSPPMPRAMPRKTVPDE